MPTNCVSVVDSQLFLSDPDQGGQLIMDPARFGKYCCQIGTGSKSLNLIKLNFFCNFLESLIYIDRVLRIRNRIRSSELRIRIQEHN
jgi:hypothetical protein